MLEGVNLHVSEGEIVGLLGRSGSGKSTLLRLIAGLSSPTDGGCIYLGQPVEGPARGVAMVFQSFAVFPWLTVFENVALGLEAMRLPRMKSAVARSPPSISSASMDSSPPIPASSRAVCASALALRGRWSSIPPFF